VRLWPFALERWQSVWENQVDLNLSESGVHPLRLDEVLDAAGLSHLAAASLGYPQTNGTPGLRAALAALYPGATAANILVTNGGSEANFVATWALLSPGDEAVVMAPNYMQLDGLVRTLGATVRPLPLVEERGWALDHAALDELVGSRTKLIAVCNPNNPTGTVLSDDDRAALVAAADRVGAWLLAYPAFVPFDLYRRSHMAHHREEFGPTEPDLMLYTGYPITSASWRRKLTRDADGNSGWKNLRSLLLAVRSPTARPVALKILPPEKASKTMKVGDFVRVSILAADGHDLVGSLV